MGHILPNGRSGEFFEKGLGESLDPQPLSLAAVGQKLPSAQVSVSVFSQNPPSWALTFEFHKFFRYYEIFLFFSYHLKM